MAKTVSARPHPWPTSCLLSSLSTARMRSRVVCTRGETMETCRRERGRSGARCCGLGFRGPQTNLALQQAVDQGGLAGVGKADHRHLEQVRVGGLLWQAQVRQAQVTAAVGRDHRLGRELSGARRRVAAAASSTAAGSPLLALERTGRGGLAGGRPREPPEEEAGRSGTRLVLVWVLLRRKPERLRPAGGDADRALERSLGRGNLAVSGIRGRCARPRHWGTAAKLPQVGQGHGRRCSTLGWWAVDGGGRPAHQPGQSPIAL